MKGISRFESTLLMQIPQQVEQRFRAFDHRCAITSHVAQDLTAHRVNINTDGPPVLINSRLAYVAIYRAAEDAHIFTNDAVSLGVRLATQENKISAVTFQQPAPPKDYQISHIPAAQAQQQGPGYSLELSR